MIVEQRTYQLVPGGAAQWMKHYEEEGIKIQRPILGNLVGYYYSEIGPLNEIVHMWAYEDLAERARKREILGKDPAWNEYLKKVRQLLVKMENKILIPFPSSPRNFT